MLDSPTGERFLAENEKLKVSKQEMKVAQHRRPTAGCTTSLD